LSLSGEEVKRRLQNLVITKRVLKRDMKTRDTTGNSLDEKRLKLKRLQTNQLKIRFFGSLQKELEAEKGKTRRDRIVLLHECLSPQSCTGSFVQERTADKTTVISTRDKTCKQRDKQNIPR
jgi:hypothetical protein